MSEIMHCMRTAPSSGNERAYEMQSLLYQLFAAFMKQRDDRTRTETFDWIKQTIDYMELHAAEGITVQDTAEAAGINRTYFSGMFTKHVGISPSGYITRIRMTKASEMLRTTSASVTEIAYSLGYTNLYAFTRAYKNYYGVSPTEYRSSGHRHDPKMG